MQLIKKYWKEIVMILLIGILVFFFPLTNKDWFFFNNFNSIKSNSIAKILDIQFLPAVLAIVLSKVKIIKIVVYTFSLSALFLLIKNTINKDNKALLYIGIFLFFLLKDDVISRGVISPYGFCMNILPMITSLLVVNMLLKDKLYDIPRLVLFTIGFISCIFNLTYSLMTFLLLLINLIRLITKKEKDKNFLWMFIGSFIGFVSLFTYNIINGKILLEEITDRLLHVVIPNIYSMDFIISLILISFLLFLSIKVYISNRGYKKVLTILSLISILLYSLARILSTNDLINYILFVVFEATSLFILTNSNNRLFFKERIYTFYYLKWLYLIIMLLSNIDISSILFIEIINIIIILTVIDYIFPKNFMKTPWYIIAVLIVVLNIYLFRGTSIKTVEMNRYIKNHLECNMFEIYLPHRYYNSFVGYLLPQEKKEKREYILYLNVEYLANTVDNTDYRVIIEKEK